MLCYCSLLDVVSQCIDEDVSIFKSTVQTVVDTLEVSAAALPRLLPESMMQPQSLIPSHTALSLLQVMRKQCSVSSHKALVTRLLFILTRCSRLVLTGGWQPV